MYIIFFVDESTLIIGAFGIKDAIKKAYGNCGGTISAEIFGQCVDGLKSKEDMFSLFNQTSCTTIKSVWSGCEKEYGEDGAK